MRARRPFSVLILFIAMLLSRSALAAAADATVSGVVVDQLGGAVEGATVTLLQGDTTIQSATTDKSGRFTLGVPASGRYELRAAAPGFLAATLDSFYVARGAHVTERVTLSIGVAQMVTVTAAAAELPISRVASPVTVIDRQTIDAAGKPSLVEVLRLVPGVSIIQAGNRGASSSLFVRGGSSYFNKVLVDGVAANDIGGAYDFADQSTTGLDRVEVLRDANSVLYGSDALAGVVSLTTRRGTTRVPEFTYAVDGGNLRTSSHELSFGGARQRLDYFAAFSNLATDNDVQNDRYRNRKFAGRVGFSAGDTDVSTVVRLGSARTGLPSTTDFFGIADDSTKTDRENLVSVTAESRLSPRWQTTVRVAALHFTYDTLDPTPTGAPYDPFGFGANYIGDPVTIVGANGYTASGRALFEYAGTYPITYHAVTDRQTITGQATYRASERTGVTAGIRAEHETGSTTYASNPSSSTDRDNYGAFVEAHASYGRAAAIGGAGFDHNAIFGFKATPRGSVALYLRNPSSTSALGDTKVVIDAGTGIKAPTIGQELSSVYAIAAKTGTAIPGVKPIGPEEASSFDVGVEQGFSQGRGRVRASVFDNRFTGVIEYVNKSALAALGVPLEAVAVTDYGAYLNSSDYTARGLELSADATVAAFRFSASYTFLDAKVTKSSSGDVLAPAFNPNIPGIPIGAYAPLLGARPFRRPTHVGNFLASYAHAALDLTLVGYITGRQDDSTFLSDADFGNTLLLPNHDLDAGYAKIDVSGGYRVARDLRGYLTIENLFDRKYEAAAGFPALPRTFRAGIKIQVGGKQGQ